jgi:DNA-binding MarR family transcriptional regulator
MVQDSLLEFARRMNEVIPVIAQGFARRQVSKLYKCELTLPQILILDFLNQQGETKMTDMAHFMRVTTAAMTGPVDRLVRDGYATRVYDPADRRVIKIKLTAHGNELVKKINEQRRKMVIKIFSHVSETDRQDYLRILLKIKDVLTQDSATLK